MAEIRVERKEGRSIWPWIVGLLVAVLVLWLLFGRDDKPRTTTGAMAPSTSDAELLADENAPSIAVGPAIPADMFTKSASRTA